MGTSEPVRNAEKRLLDCALHVLVLGVIVARSHLKTDNVNGTATLAAASIRCH